MQPSKALCGRNERGKKKTTKKIQSTTLVWPTSAVNWMAPRNLGGGRNRFSSLPTIQTSSRTRYRVPRTFPSRVLRACSQRSNVQKCDAHNCVSSTFGGSEAHHQFVANFRLLARLGESPKVWRNNENLLFFFISIPDSVFFEIWETVFLKYNFKKSARKFFSANIIELILQIFVWNLFGKNNWINFTNFDLNFIRQK